MRLRGLVLATHALPTVVVTITMSAFAWSIGWRGAALVLVGVTILTGQMSVGWSNDAFDAASDTRAGRRDKPTVAGQVSVRVLWISAATALVVSIALSWWVAGFVGGSFHVLVLGMAWLYNVALSRTAWSWLPYAVAFGAMPLFLYIGLDGRPGPWWTVAVFAIVAVGAHLANALPDLESDREAGLGGVVVVLGAPASTRLCWLLLGVGTAILIAVGATSSAGPWLAVVLVAGYLGALLYGSLSSRRSAMFVALVGAVALDVIALTVSPAL